MKTFVNQAAQGDVMFIRVDKLPSEAKKINPTEGNHIVAHSETGHSHVIKDDGMVHMYAANDPMIMFLVVDNEADLIHNRGHDTHEPLRFDKGIYEIRRQREHTPEGWRRVAD